MAKEKGADGKFRMVVDAKAQPWFEAVDFPPLPHSAFSPDSSSWVYQAWENGQALLLYDGFSVLPCQEIAFAGFADPGITFSCQDEDGYWSVRAWVTGGELHEDDTGPYEPPFKAFWDGMVWAFVTADPAAVFEGPDFSVTLPFNALSLTHDMVFTVPDYLVAGFGPENGLAFFGAKEGLPGALNAFAVFLSWDNLEQVSIIPFMDIEGLADYPALSPDATRLAFAAKAKGKVRVFLADVKDNAFGEDPAFDEVKGLVFSPSGGDVAYAVSTEKGWQAFYRGLQGPACNSIKDICFSGDGRRLAWLGKKEAAWSVFVDGNEIISGFPLAAGPAFSPDSRSLYFYAAKDDGIYRVTALNPPAP
ncbi:MAG: hypothetical protein QMD09_06910 [Desulfatibacillaceae bacterium]|nr:hypothetical protein [Desulfatibacillaceae bacterium]